jgi:uncharacterized protein (TIGR02246 family)
MLTSEAGAMNVTAISQEAPDHELEAITAVVAALERSQRNELVEEFVGLFSEHAVWTTAHGRRLFGRDEIAAFTRRVLPGAMTGLVPTYRVEHVVFIRPDVAAVKVIQRYATTDGQPAEGEPQGSPLYVMAKEDEQWRLVAGQNTVVLEP